MRVSVYFLAAMLGFYRPRWLTSPRFTKTDKKIKKSSNTLALELVKTPDTLAELGQLKSENQILIGFALETNDAVDNASGKLKRKNLDLIVLNTLEDKGAGFGHDTNKITTIDKTGEICTFDLKE